MTVMVMHDECNCAALKMRVRDRQAAARGAPNKHGAYEECKSCSHSAPLRHCNDARSCTARRKASFSEPRRIRILTSTTAVSPGASAICGSTCWHVSSGLLQTLPVVRVTLATTQALSDDTV